LKDVNIVPDQGGVVCTADAMQCPDGSYVGRTGPHCEFVCPTGSTTSNPPPSGGGGSILPYNSGIKGTVMAGPTCPVERNPPDPNCADKPLSVPVSVYRTSDTTQVFAETTSDTAGTFKLSLPPGNYVVKAARESMLPRCNQITVTVG